LIRHERRELESEIYKNFIWHAICNISPKGRTPWPEVSVYRRKMAMP